MRFVLFCVFFFFKQKTAYEMRISDWSSDVCSSDLAQLLTRDRDNPKAALVRAIARYRKSMHQLSLDLRTLVIGGATVGLNQRYLESAVTERSEERRVGKECVSQCRSRW